MNLRDRQLVTSSNVDNESLRTTVNPSKIS